MKRSRRCKRRTGARFSPRLGQRGFTYAEVLLATILIAITLVPALEALSGGLGGVAVARGSNELSLRASSRMEEVMSLDWATLDSAALAAGSATTPTSLSDGVSVLDRRLVYLAHYDGDNADADNDPFTGADADLIWVKVSIENAGHELSSLVAR